jgi:hypothetical protein
MGGDLMPDRKIITYTPTALNATDVVQDLVNALSEGWQLDKAVYQSGGIAKPIILENAVVYHLIKYSAEEIEEQQKQEEEKESKVIKVARESTVEGVNKRLDEGYVIVQEWAKETLLHLHEEDVKQSETVTDETTITEAVEKQVQENQ